MRSEKFDRFHPFATFRRTILRTRDEALAEIMSPCSRFKPIMSTEEKLRSFITDRMSGIDIFSDASLLAGHSMPLNWQRLLEYLHTEGITTSPQFTFRHDQIDRPHIFNFQLMPTQDAQTTDGHVEHYYGFGGSLSKEEAMSKAVGETLERYFLTQYKRDSFVKATFKEMRTRGKTTLDIDSLNKFLPWQTELFPFLDYDENTPFYWMLGEVFGGGGITYLPAQLVYWNYHRHDQGHTFREKMIIRQTTSGSAGHFTKEEAVLAALLEAIQRDGFVIYWLNSLSPHVIDVTSIEDRGVQDFLAYIRRYELEAVFLNTTSDIGIPTATCVMIDRRDPAGPVIAIGSSTGFDLASTITHSAIEALLVSNYVTTQEAFTLPPDYKPFRDSKILRLQRLTMWRGPEMEKQFAFFLQGKKQTPEAFMGDATRYTTPSEQLGYVMGQLNKRGHGYEVYIHEVQHIVLETLGYHVVRAIVPQLLPLYLTEFTPTLDSKRLREVPSKLGFKAAETFNPLPHPFP